MIVLLAAVVGVFAFAMLWKELAAKNRPKRVSKVAVGAAGVLLAVLAMLTASGRLHWLAAVLAGALPILRWVAGLFAGPLIANWLRSGGGWSPFQRTSAAPAGGGANDGTSSVATADLSMTLDHATGDMDGEVLAGAFAGRKLSELDLTALRTLRESFTAPDSVQLLDAYLDRRFPGWCDSSTRSDATPARDMDENQALAVLGLAAGASDAEVVEAHRRLMQKLHPDRGGTDYLAATLNLAKEVLMSR